MNFFDRINHWIRGSEASLVNLLSALAPWGAPIPPAYMSWHHMTVDLGFPPVVAWITAGVVEALGFSAINTILGFWSYNKRRNVAEYKKAPVWLATMSFLAYLIIVLTINVVMDAAQIISTGDPAEWLKVASRGLLVLLAIPAGVILGVRTQHKELLDTISREKQERIEQRRRQEAPQVAPSNGGGQRMKNQFVLDVRSGRLNSVLEEHGLPLSAQALMEIYGISRRSAYRYLKSLKNGGGTDGV